MVSLELLRTYEWWLEFIRELLDHSQEFPRWEVQRELAATLDTMVSWNWENADGSYGFELSRPVEGWPSEPDREIAVNGPRDLHPLLVWFRTSQDPRPMSIGRIPKDMVPYGDFELNRDLVSPVGLVQELSIPCQLRPGHRAYVAAKDGDDFSDESFEFARLIQPLLALLWMQCSALKPSPPGRDSFGLTCRERAVLELLADGHTAVAIAHRLGVSPRTVHSHLTHIYRKMGVSDRMRAVQLAEAAGVLAVRHE